MLRDGQGERGTTMKRVGVFYGSTTGNTKKVADQIAELLDLDGDAIDVVGDDHPPFEEYEGLILGVSTWGAGEAQDDWLEALPALSRARLAGTKVAIFGLGDQGGYPDSFVDAMRDLYDAAISAGATVVGAWDTDGYTFDESRAVIDNRFVGLALDEDNQADLTDDRLSNWVARLRTELELG